MREKLGKIKNVHQRSDGFYKRATFRRAKYFVHRSDGALID